MPSRSNARAKRSRKGVSYAAARAMALKLPGVEDGLSYGTPALKVCGKFLARLREDGETLVLKIGLIERQELIESQPETFFITDHYRNYPAVLIRLREVGRSQLSDLFTGSWQELVPKRLMRSDVGKAKRLK